MNVKVIIGSIIVAICIITIGLIAVNKPNIVLQIATPTPSPTPFIPYQAAFAIVTNGTVRTFNTPMYFNQSELAYLTADEPNIVQIKTPNLTWQQFFDTLPFKLSPTCLTTGTGQTFCSNETTALRFFLNGTEHPQALQAEIQPKDRLLITYGVSTESDVIQQLNLFPLVD